MIELTEEQQNHLASITDERRRAVIRKLYEKANEMHPKRMQLASDPVVKATSSPIDLGF